MSPQEIDEFFKYNPDTRKAMWLSGAKSGINSLVDAFANAGMFKKHTLEKIRFRALSHIDEMMKEQNKDV